MSTDRLAALHFAHPDLDAGGMPGFRTTGGGALGVVTDHMAIRQSLLLLLSTLPGERVRRPDYGCDLNQLMFAPNDATTHGLAIHYVTRAVARWEPRVLIRTVDAAPDPGDAAIMVLTLDYTIRQTGAEDRIAVALDLQGGVARQ